MQMIKSDQNFSLCFCALWVVTSAFAPLCAEDIAASSRGLAADNAKVLPTVTNDAQSGSLEALEEEVVAHFASINIEHLANFLVPEGWVASFDLPDSLATQTVVFHAETTRKRALEAMLKVLNLKGTIYPKRGIVLISEGGQ